MNEQFIPLSVTSGVKGVYLGPLRGTDEIAVEDIATKTGLRLIEGLLSKKNHYPASDFSVVKIVTADRDRIFAHLYTSIYGSKVESTLQCSNCEEQFDLDFLIPDLVKHYRLTGGLLQEDGTYHLEPGIRFRLPTGEDELMLEGLSQAAAEDLLMKRCLVEGDYEKDRAVIQKIMEEIAPVLNIDMQASCPECGHSQQVQFDIQSFLLTKLKQERPWLIREIHRIALHYHWPHEVIMALPRNLRKQYAALIEAEIY